MSTHKNRALPFVLSIAMTASVVSAHANADETSFEMSAYENSPGGPEVMAGAYAAAITAARTRVGPVDFTFRLVAVTNLCVAYTVERQLEKASAACDEAVVLARSVDDDRIGSHRDRAALAKALSNRGVQRALAGRTAAAADDFHEAMELGGGWPAPGRNLAHLETKASYRVARTEAASVSAAGD